MGGSVEGGGFRPMGGGDPGEFGFDYHQMPPISGQKRGNPFSGRGGSPDRFDGGSFAKLFVGSVPRTATEEDIRPLFEEHGNVIEVALIKDKKTGQQQGCCFIKYATLEEADRAIRALHNQHTLPGGIGPVQVRYADGERERLGAVEYKLFVGSLNKQATENEVEEIFSQFGRVEDVYLMRDERKQSRGCGFVKYGHRDMALAAINSLNGIYTMRGCDQPLTVRFADPKRPRSGDSRGGPAFGGPGFGPRFQAPGPRQPSNFGEPMTDQVPPPNTWRPMHPPNYGSFSNASVHGFGGQLHPKSGDMVVPLNSGGPLSGYGGLSDTLPASQQNFNQSMPQIPPSSQEIAPLQKPIHSPQNFPPSLQLHSQPPMAYTQTQTSLAPPRLPQLPQYAGQAPLSQTPPSQQLIGRTGLLPASQPQLQKVVSSTPIVQPPSDNSLQSRTAPTTPNKQQLPAPGQQQLLQPPQQSPSQLAQMLSQQTQTLQASFHSSQQAFSQLQQQLQQMQPSTQCLTLQQNTEATKKQSQWHVVVPQIAASTPAAAPATGERSSTSAAADVPVISHGRTPIKFNWTEHTSPDGYKYYYNGLTGESRWEKPEELTLLEQHQQQKPSLQQSQTQSQPQILPVQQIPQMQPVHHSQIQSQPQGLSARQGTQMQQSDHQGQAQARVHHPQQLQQTSLPAPYQSSGAISHQSGQEVGYTQFQSAISSVGDPPRFPQGLNSAQEWMRK
ncbi:flowering time control protein FCA [Quillaja saponaria]|uniref:Flowering time control protein FCA n=1 Tax=Quillaja saponaria TaxID=32244 RepID=A0AAD7PH19_QUISA|nr:flowering time control protein FCA [Quillaja saponaria]